MFRIEEETVKELERNFLRGRIARPQFAVQLDNGFVAVFHLVQQQGVVDGGVARFLVDVDEAELHNSAVHELGEFLFRERIVRLAQDFSRFRIDDVSAQALAFYF